MSGPLSKEIITVAGLEYEVIAQNLATVYHSKRGTTAQYTAVSVRPVDQRAMSGVKESA